MPRRNASGRPRLRIVPRSTADAASSGAGGGEGGERPEDTALRYAAARAAAQPFYLASVLKEYQEMEREDDDALAARLGIPAEALWKLALCRAPDVDSADFRSELQRIAAHAGAHPSALLGIVRSVSSARAFRDASPAADLLLAARDRIPEPESDEAEPDGEAP